MLLTRLLLLPFAVASTVTLYVSSVPASEGTAVISSAIPLAQIEYDADQAVGTLASYTPPTGSYSDDHLLRVGLTDPKSGSWRGIVTSASSFADQYHKKFIVHVDEKGEPFHVGFGTSAKGVGKEVEVEIVKRSPGPKPVLNKPIVLNAEGKLDSKEPEKTFLQKYVLSLAQKEDTKINVFIGTGGRLRSSLSYSWYLAEERANRWSTKDIEQTNLRPGAGLILTQHNSYASSSSTSSPSMIRACSTW
jgi:hypothetical protein